MHRVQIKNEKPGWKGTQVFVDDKKIQGVTEVNFNVAVDSVPEFIISTNGIPDIDAIGQVIIDPSPLNLKDSCIIMLEELKKHGDFYKAFICSVQSALREVPSDAGIWTNELAEKIVRRIAGDE